jgi:serine O-acetyltransferase
MTETLVTSPSTPSASLELRTCESPQDARAASRPSHDEPLPIGDSNGNPGDIGLLALLAEDLRTHDGNPLEAGFVALAMHRLANARMDIRPRLLRAPFSLLYKLLYPVVSWAIGIDIPYPTRIGRRVRIWHRGGIWLGARAIGDDVHIRHNTTFGVLNRSDLEAKPMIGNRVDIGVGAGIFGAVTVGDDAMIGPNSVVVRDVPPGSTVMGVPARQAAIWKEPSEPART